MDSADEPTDDESSEAGGDDLGDEPATADSGVADVLDAEHLFPAFGRGIASFVAGYLVTLLVVVVGPATTSGRLADIGSLIAFVFYGAHNVSVQVANLGAINVLAEQQNPETPLIVFWLVPIVVLLLAGVELAGRYLSRKASAADLAASVFAVALGYAAVMFLGTFVFRTQTMFQVAAKIVAGDAVVFGFAYPAVFVLLGASATMVYRRATVDSEIAEQS